MKTKFTFRNICEQECELCQNGLERLEPEESGAYHRFAFGVFAGDCTAPSMKDLIARLLWLVQSSAYIAFSQDDSCRVIWPNGRDGDSEAERGPIASTVYRAIDAAMKEKI